MTLDEVRHFALSLPETTEEPHFEKTSFRVCGKIFATVPLEAEHLHILLDEATADGIIAHDRSFEPLRWGRRLMGVRVTLATADRERVNALLEEAWRLKAPKRLLAGS